MRWRRLGADDEGRVRTFLSAREHSCASAVSRFKELAASGLGVAAPGAAWAGFDEDGAISSLVIAMKSGLVSVVLSDPSLAANRRALERILGARRLSSVQGLRPDVEAAERAAARTRRLFGGRVEADPIDYVLMRLDRPPAAEALAAGPPGIEIRRAVRGDAELLFPLQAAYEMEEVIPKGGSFNAAAARLSFERALGERIVLYALVDGAAAGKAGTNARAFSVDQIGGVYVRPEFRGRGIARRLVAELCRVLAEEGRGAALFVKRRNESARRAYESVGFAPGDDYRITYYTENNK